MDTHVCKKCNYTFSNKYSLERHLNAKRKCNQKTEFKCDKCKRCFKYNKSLKEHIENNVCNKNKNINDTTDTPISNNLEKNILELIESDTNNKCFLFKILGVKMNDDEINEILKSNISVNLKISCFVNNINKNNTSNNISNNISNSNISNTTNNIMVNNFGNENIDYIKPEYITKLLQNNYGKDSFLKLSNQIYLNKNQPQNNTIKIENMNNKFCKIIENNKWITTTKDKALNDIFNKVVKILMDFMDDISDLIPEKKINIIYDYLNKDFDDPYIKETVSQFILDIYNFTINEK